LRVMDFSLAGFVLIGAHDGSLSFVCSAMTTALPEEIVPYS
jgi:hypothetical protein